LTLGTDKVGDVVTNWHVSDEISVSDHRYIVFQVGDLEVTRLTYHNPNQENLKANLGFCQELYARYGMYSWLLTSCNRPSSCPVTKDCPARVDLTKDSFLVEQRVQVF
jgi:hypothetical protein